MKANHPNGRAVFRKLSAVFGVLGVYWGGGMLMHLVHGFAETDGYHKREFNEALPMLILLTLVGIGFLVAAWFF